MPGRRLWWAGASAFLDLRTQVGLLLVVIGVAASVNLWLHHAAEDPDRAARAAALQLQQLSARAAVAGLVTADTGNEAARSDAQRLSAETNGLLEALSTGDAGRDITAVAAAERAALRQARTTWVVLHGVISRLTSPGAPAATPEVLSYIQLLDAALADTIGELVAGYDHRLQKRTQLRMRWSIAGNLVLAAVGAGTLAITVLTVVRPMRRLTSLTARVGSGDFDARYGRTYPLGSLRTLTRAVDDMARRLSERERTGIELQRQVETDALTGLDSRRAFFARLELAIGRAEVSDEDFVVCYLDVNGFKRINDSFGHHVGDQALIDVAQIMRAAFRASDVVARLGGDEFAAIAFGVSEADAGELRDRLDGYVEEFNAFADRPYQLALSTGIVGYSPLLTADALLQLADEARYREKHGAPANNEAA